MKKIILVRHAKSSWEKPFLRDHDRPLAERGIKAAPEMGKRLKSRNIEPDLILSSTAERAKSTAQLISKELQQSDALVRLDKNLYHASPPTLLSIIRKLPESLETVLLVGHNPGLNDLANQWGASLENLPTAAVYAVKANSTWTDFNADKVEFWFYDFPKNKA
ncbi:phosphohistidine phosphatase [Algoriphagus faecimaris]|uniref:Phosphohistidine phosphatase n=1 Tax=Algoriphagus faecimaris TaxID=686796 RepID=A0A1G6W0X3_9BACT|nr:histidine phosphatase family protein [Algoriphagus faecimaris]SDD58706.1 phosphohistidine phosphatase [Algoriphagus faecimaris]